MLPIKKEEDYNNNKRRMQNITIIKKNVCSCTLFFSRI